MRAHLPFVDWLLLPVVNLIASQDPGLTGLEDGTATVAAGFCAAVADRLAKLLTDR